MGSQEPKILGTSKVRGKGVISLVKEAAQILDAKDGDHIAYYYDENYPDYVIISKVKIQAIKEPIRRIER
jgi:hypothetical protein